MRILAWAVAFLLSPCVADAQPRVLDDFAEPGRWEVIRTEGVELGLRTVPGVEGDALRLEYDFTKGAGFCIIRREFDLSLPVNYRFDLFARGEGPANDLEFKLVSPSGDDVWWNNRRAFEPPAGWTKLRNRARHFEFAWGPSDGARLERVGAIEFAIASSQGGSGFIELDELTFEVLPDLDPRPVGGLASKRTRSGESLDLGVVGNDGAIGVGVSEDDEYVEISFDHPVEFGSIELGWTDKSLTPPCTDADPYSIAISDDGENFRTIRWVRLGRGNVHAFSTPETEARAVRLVPGDDFVADRLVSFRLVPIEETPDINAFWSRRARAAQRGAYPPYFGGERAAWTVVGLPDDTREALISEYGAIEPFKGGFTIEPRLEHDATDKGRRRVTWADAEVSCSLDGDSLPIPTVSWATPGIGLDITPVVTGAPGSAELLVRYRVRNNAPEPRLVRLLLAVQPYQVLPTSHALNIVGGFSPIHAIKREGDRLVINGSTVIRLSGFAGWGLGTAPGFHLLDRWCSGLAPEPVAEFGGTLRRDPSIRDGQGFAAGLLVFPLEIPAGEYEDVVLSVPMHEIDPDSLSLNPVGPSEFEASLETERDRWQALLDSPRITVPVPQQNLVETLRTAIAQMLINQDGPAIQPGSRTYERSWIRDGSVTSLAMIHAGLGDHARGFIEWYAGYQFESGKVPCVVDHRGPDPVDEHDSTGQFIFALRNAAIAAGDAEQGRALLRDHYDHVVRGVGYMESLRAQRLTDEYTTSEDPIARACAGLMPESISHEGYSAKPMHSYWDDFWALRGYLDAADIARRLGHDTDADRFAAIASEFREDFYTSIRLAAAHHGIDYVPGCVELGDFDATSTSIAVFPVGELGKVPEPLLTNTFEKYWRFFVNRRDGDETWNDMTPYECRIVGAFVRLGWSERAHELMNWLLKLRSPTGWNQWGEIAYADPSPGRFVGDMPHTWVASGYVLSLLSMFAYEHGDEIVLAPAIPQDWVFSPEGVGVDGMWTRWGPLSYTLRGVGGSVSFELIEAPDAPGGFTLRLPPNATDVRVVGGSRPSADGFVRLHEGERRVEYRVER